MTIRRPIQFSNERAAASDTLHAGLPVAAAVSSKGLDVNACGCEVVVVGLGQEYVMDGCGNE